MFYINGERKLGKRMRVVKGGLHIIIISEVSQEYSSIYSFSTFGDSRPLFKNYSR